MPPSRYLETVLRKSTLDSMRRYCAGQLALAGRKSGFLHLRENFPALRNASDQQILDYLKSHQ